MNQESESAKDPAASKASPDHLARLRKFLDLKVSRVDGGKSVRVDFPAETPRFRVLVAYLGKRATPAETPPSVDPAAEKDPPDQKEDQA